MTSSTHRSFIREIKSEDRERMAVGRRWRGRGAANSILKQVADWSNSFSSLSTKPHRCVSVILYFQMAGFTTVENSHNFMLLLEKDDGIRNSPLWVHFRLMFWVFLLAVDDILFFMWTCLANVR